MISEIAEILKDTKLTFFNYFFWPFKNQQINITQQIKEKEINWT